MSTEETFDELARHKLQDMEAPAQQEDFLAMEALLDARQQKRRRRVWPFYLLGLLLMVGIGAGTVNFLAQDSTSHTTGHASVPGKEADTNASAQVRETSIGTHSTQPAALPEHAQPEPPSLQQPEQHTEVPSAARHEREHSAQAEPTPTATNTHLTVPAATPDRARAVTSGTITTSTALATAGQHHGAESPQPRNDAPWTEVTSATPPTVSDQPATAAHVPAMHERSAFSTNPLSLLRTGLPLPLTVQDPLAHPAPPALHIPVLSPWEILVGIGGQSSTSQYGGIEDMTQGMRTARRISATGGIELLYRKQGWGFGIGAHWTGYEENVTVDALHLQRIDLHRRWAFVAVDTSVLVITDTITQGGSVTYAGHHQDTTLLVFTRRTDTLRTDLVDRKSSRTANRTTYIEIPLLLDINRPNGKWEIGMRGGPTVGLLMGRNGALPTTEGDGYYSFENRSFRSLILGYHLRGYLHYRLHPAWSIGLEPFARGQLMNAMAGQEVARRSAAQGLLFTLRYRIMEKRTVPPGSTLP